MYRIMWYKSVSDLKRGANFSTTPNTTFMIHGLDECESYHVAVMVTEPLGMGPESEKQARFMTDVYSSFDFNESLYLFSI